MNNNINRGTSRQQNGGQQLPDPWLGLRQRRRPRNNNNNNGVDDNSSRITATVDVPTQSLAGAATNNGANEGRATFASQQRQEQQMLGMAPATARPNPGAIAGQEEPQQVQANININIDHRNPNTDDAGPNTHLTVKRLSRIYCIVSAVGAMLAIITSAGATTNTSMPTESAAMAKALAIDVSQQQHPVFKGDRQKDHQGQHGSVFFESSQSTPLGGEQKKQEQRKLHYHPQNSAADEEVTASPLYGSFDLEQWVKMTFGGAWSLSGQPSGFSLFSAKKNKKREHRNRKEKQQQVPTWLRWLDQLHLKSNNDKEQHTQQSKVHDSWAAKTNKREKQVKEISSSSDEKSATTSSPYSAEYNKETSSKGFRNILQRFVLGPFLNLPSLFVSTVCMLDPSLASPSQSTLTDLIDKVLTSPPRLLAIANLLLALTFLLHTAVADWFLGTNNGNNSNGNHIHNNNNNNNNATPAARAATMAAAAAPAPDWTAATATTSNRAVGGERLGGFLVFKLLLISAVVSPDTLDLLILLSWYTLLSFLRSLAHLCANTSQHTALSGQMPRSGVLRLLLVVLVSDFLAAACCVALFHGAGLGMVMLLTSDCALLAVDVVGHIMQHVTQVLEMQHAENITALEEEQWASAGLGSNRADDAAAAAAPVPRLPDDRVEALEQQQSRRLSILDAVIFSLQLLSAAITVLHFIHIWSLHGVQFTLIDGVLALHLQAAISAASKKITVRRNMNRIARDLDGMFQDATEQELMKAAQAGDTCCICLGTMQTVGSVKKVACGHLYHTTCLREVVERAQSLEAAKCPLCRASVCTGLHEHRRTGNNNAQTNGNENVDGQGAIAAPVNTGGLNNGGGGVNEEYALFRFSTENILPAWLPLPAFSFEIVRRPPPPTMHETEATTTTDTAPAPPTENRTEIVEEQQPSSRLRQWLVAAGAIPMSPADEAAALEQLVDMFPQHNRAVLLAELRQRFSAEAVAEAVLLGAVSPTAGARAATPVA